MECDISFFSIGLRVNKQLCWRMFGVQGSEFKVQGYQVQGSGFRVQYFGKITIFVLFLKGDIALLHLWLCHVPLEAHCCG